MTDTFITKIQVNQARNIRDLTIPLSETERRHLIITGKNGSGKTGLLEELAKFLRLLESSDYEHPLDRVEPYMMGETERFKRSQADAIFLDRANNGLDGTKISFTEYPPKVSIKIRAGNFLIAFYEAKRQTQLTVPKGIEKVSLKEKYPLDERVGPAFLQYLVNLKAERSFARDDGDDEAVRKIDAWFAGLENRLRELFQSPGLELRFDRRRYNFEIMEEEGKAPFDFNTLADGYSAILGIVTDLILRMEGHGGGAGAHDQEGLVLIDEIETHLHVELQKKILPFLIDFFPRVQFIVTTHSPFVLSSVANAVICDLEEHTVTEDLSAYSYDALVESYFETDKYSETVKEKLSRYEALLARESPSAQEAGELRRLRDYLSSAPKYLSRELALKLQQLELPVSSRRPEGAGGG